MDLRSPSCARCGAPAPIPLPEAARCAYCGTHLVSEPRGPLISSPKLGGGDLDGFRDSAQSKKRGLVYETDPSAQGVLRVHLPRDDAEEYLVLWLPRMLDDVDVSLEGRFERAAGARASISLWLRTVDDRGAYTVRLGAGGDLDVGWRDTTALRGYLARTPGSHAGRKTAGAFHLRAVVLGDRLQAFVDGALVASVRDARFREGRVFLAACSGDGATTIAIHALEVRGALPGA